MLRNIEPRVPEFLFFTNIGKGGVWASWSQINRKSCDAMFPEKWLTVKAARKEHLTGIEIKAREFGLDLDELLRSAKGKRS